MQVLNCAGLCNSAQMYWLTRRNANKKMENKVQFITLTTDFGSQDFYAGALKGALLKGCPNVQLVDLTHAIKPFDILQAAFIVGNVWNEFPEGSLHLIGVNCVYQSEARFVAARHGGHFFLVPDNGVLTLLFPDWPSEDLRFLAAPEPGHFPVKAVFAAAAAHLCAGAPFEALGEHPAPLLRRISLQPVITPTRIRGTIIHIDNFENVVINIRREVFEQVGKGRPFSLYFKRHDPITQLSAQYSDVPTGEQLCLFNIAGYLEIAINMGRAASLLSLKVEDVVELVFEES
jgi:S-adenosyl-L-methionine hydrolase (adenosine-forming)